MLTEMDKLSYWLTEEIKNRGWSIRELARRAEISHTTISDVLAEQRIPTFDFCVAIAKPLDEDPVELFRMAGLIPSISERIKPTKSEKLIGLNELSRWLSAEIKKRNWSIYELARRADISHTIISDVLEGQQIPTFDFCYTIAIILDKNPIDLFQIAGLLPPEPSEKEISPQPTLDQMIRDIWQALRQTPPTPAAANQIAEPKNTYQTFPGDQTTPDLENIMDLCQHLDQAERQAVYDYVRWRLLEQHSRRDSSGVRHKPSLEELTTALEHLSSKERKHLIEKVFRYYQENNNNLLAESATQEDE